MKRPYISEKIRRYVIERDKSRCAYCQLQQEVVGLPLQVQHIIPITAEGSSDKENLCSSCSLCNSYKGAKTHAIDPETDILSELFNPRIRQWQQHFYWDEEGIMIIGRTPIGRATVSALKLNHQVRLVGRRRWVGAGWHPPSD